MVSIYTSLLHGSDSNNDLNLNFCNQDGDCCDTGPLLSIKDFFPYQVNLVCNLPVQIFKYLTNYYYHYQGNYVDGIDFFTECATMKFDSLADSGSARFISGYEWVVDPATIDDLGLSYIHVELQNGRIFM